MSQTLGQVKPSRNAKGRQAENVATDAGIPAGLPARMNTDQAVAAGTPEVVDLGNDPQYQAIMAGEAVAIHFPLGDPPASGHARRFVSLSVNLDREQAATFQRLYYGLHNRSTRLASGRHVENAADVVRWLLEQAATATGHDQS